VRVLRIAGITLLISGITWALCLALAASGFLKPELALLAFGICLYAGAFIGLSALACFAIQVVIALRNRYAGLQP
jgi:hypothetical protein